MQPVVSVLFNYFIPLIKVSTRFGFASTLYLIANLESAAKLMRTDQVLDGMALDEVNLKSLGGREDSDLVPSMSAISQFHQLSCLNRLTNDWTHMEETIDFYGNLSMTKFMHPREISQVTFKEDSYNKVSDMLPGLSYLDDGKLADRFGVMKFFSRIFVETATNHVSEKYVIKWKEKAATFGRVLDETIDAYLQDQPELSKTQNLTQCIYYLKNASKYQLKELGMNTETCLFSHRLEYATRVEELGFDAESPEVRQLLNFLNQKMRNDEIVMEYIQDDSRFLLNEASNKFLMHYHYLMNLGLVSLEDYLIKIDSHPKSAKLMSKRIKNFEFGTEIVAYSPTLIVDLMGHKRFDELQNITDNHPEGVKGALHANIEAIFQKAFDHLMDEKGSEPRSIEYLIKAKFPFKGVHKKALMKRAVIAKNDFNLLRLLLDHQVIDLSEYQENRGITFYHSILLEGSDELRNFAAKHFLVDNPNDAIKFVPAVVCDVNGREKVPYWTCEEDLLDVRPAVAINLGPFMRIRKGWDSLTLAAVIGHADLFTFLLNRDASSAKYKQVGPFLLNQSIFKNLLKSRGH